MYAARLRAGTLVKTHHVHLIQTCRESRRKRQTPDRTGEHAELLTINRFMLDGDHATPSAICNNCKVLVGIVAAN